MRLRIHREGVAGHEARGEDQRLGARERRGQGVHRVLGHVLGDVAMWWKLWLFLLVYGFYGFFLWGLWIFGGCAWFSMFVFFVSMGGIWK